MFELSAPQLLPDSQVPLCTPVDVTIVLDTRRIPQILHDADAHIVLFFPSKKSYNERGATVFEEGSVVQPAEFKNALVFQVLREGETESGPCEWTEPMTNLCFPTTVQLDEKATTQTFTLKFSPTRFQKIHCDHADLQQFVPLAMLVTPDGHTKKDMRIVRLASQGPGFSVLPLGDPDMKCTMVKLNLNMSKDGSKIVYDSRYDNLVTQSKKDKLKNIREKLTICINHVDLLREAMSHYSTEKKTRLKIKGPLLPTDMDEITAALNGILHDSSIPSSKVLLVGLKNCTDEEVHEMSARLLAIKSDTDVRIFRGLPRVDEGHMKASSRRSDKFMKFVYACGKVSFFDNLRSHDTMMSMLGHVTDLKWRGPLDAFDALHLVSLVVNHPTIVKLRLPSTKVVLTLRSQTILANGFKSSPLVLRLGKRGSEEKLNLVCKDVDGPSKIEETLAKMCNMVSEKGNPLEFVSFEETFT